MATVHQSIDVKAPVHVLYNQLTRFEDYPRFMEDVASVIGTKPSLGIVGMSGH